MLRGGSQKYWEMDEGRSHGPANLALGIQGCGVILSLPKRSGNANLGQHSAPLPAWKSMKPMWPGQGRSRVQGPGRPAEVCPGKTSCARTGRPDSTRGVEDD